MNKLILIATLVVGSVALSGCGWLDRRVASVTGYTKVCVDGVTYLQFTSGATVQVDRTGRPVACGAP